VWPLTQPRVAIGVARGATFLITQTIVNALISVAAFAFIARALTRENMGILAVLTIVASGAQVLSGLGVASTATQFVASLQGQGDSDSASRAGYSCLIVNACMTAIVASATFFSADSLGSYLLGTASRASFFRLLTWDVAAAGVNYSLSSLLLGLKRFRNYSLASMIGFAVRQSAVVTLLVVGMGLPGIIVGWGIGDSFLALMLATNVRSALGPFRVGFGFRKLIRFSSPLFLGELATFTYSYFDRILLIPLVSLAELGVYNVAVTAYAILNGVPSSISSALFPFYSHFYAGGAKASGSRDLENAVKTASRYVSLLTVPLAVGLATTSLPAVTLLAGGNYADAAYPLAVLSLFLAVACVVKALGQIFIVLERTVTSAAVTVASILLGILSGVMLVPRFGIIGASLARGLSLIAVLGFTIIILKRMMNLRFDTRAYRNAWVASIVMVVTTLAFEKSIYSKYLLPVYVLAGGITFLVSIRFLQAVGIDDMELLSNFLPKRLRFLARWLSRVLGVASTRN
jgi:O-antigen/teichoic acid export membrane protein